MNMALKACWIWQKGDPFKPNTYCYFRRVYKLNNKPAKAECRVSADSAYKLFINGKLVGRGPILVEPRWQSYDTYDLTRFLKAGANIIAAIVYHYGNALENPCGPTVNWSRGGFLCQIDMEEGGIKSAAGFPAGNKKTISMITDTSWKVFESQAWDGKSPQIDRMTYAEFYDARQEPEGWLEADFAAEDWVPAVAVTADELIKQWVWNPSPSRVLPWLQLEPRSIPYFVYKTDHPEKIVKLGEVMQIAEPRGFDSAVRMSLEELTPLKHTNIANRRAFLGLSQGPVIVTPQNDNISYDNFTGVFAPSVVLDNGHLVNGRVELDIEGPKGAVIDIGYAQILLKGKLIPYLSHRTPLADQYILKKGRQVFTTFNWRNFRYVQLTFRNMAVSVKLHSLRVVSENYPFEPKGNFQCDDKRLNRIWMACVETLKLCTYDRFMDNPSRERREYTGDILSALQCTYAAFGETAIIKKYFTDIRRGQSGYGFFPTCVLGNKRECFKNYPEAAFLFVIRVWEYYEIIGKRDVISELFQPIIAFMNFIKGFTDKDGLIGQMPFPTFIDWADVDRRGHSLVLNALYAQSCFSFARIAQTLGEDKIAAEYDGIYNKLKLILSAEFWNKKKGVFIDALIAGVPSNHYSEHANFAMVLFKMASKKQIASLEKVMRHPTLQMGQLEPLAFWLAEALFSIGQTNWALEMMRQRYDRMWKEGLTTIGELWHLFGERYTGRWRPRDSRSAAQMGGVSAAFLLSRYLLGVIPLRPGFEEVLIAPQPGDLKWVKGTWPSPRGNIDVSWKKTRGLFKIECRLPPKIKGRLALPFVLSAVKTFKINGRRVDADKEIKDGSIPVSGAVKIEVTNRY